MDGAALRNSVPQQLECRGAQGAGQLPVCLSVLALCRALLTERTELAVLVGGHGAVGGGVDRGGDDGSAPGQASSSSAGTSKVI
eukprot:1761083-Rhodomonas_salina.9